MAVYSRRKAARFCLAGLAVLILASTAAAQMPHAEKKVGFGIRGGLSLASFTGPDADESWKTRNGLTTAAFVSIPIAGRLSLQPEVAYVQKGAEREILLIIPVGVEETITAELDYLEITPMVRFELLNAGDVSWSLLSGPWVAFNLSARLEGEERIESYDYSNAESTTLGGSIGSVVQLVGRPAFFLDIRYSYAFTDAFGEGVNFVPDYDGSPLDWDVDIRNTVLSLSAGVAF